VEARRRKLAVQKLSRRSDEWLTGVVLHFARALPEDGDACP
jgi:hypothetical protein